MKAKDELATALVRVLHTAGTARNFLVDIVMDEVTNDGANNVIICKNFSDRIFRLHQRTSTIENDVCFFMS